MKYEYRVGWMDNGALAVFVCTPMGLSMVMSFEDIKEFNEFTEQMTAFRAKIADVGIPKIMGAEVNK